MIDAIRRFIASSLPRKAEEPTKEEPKAVEPKEEQPPKKVEPKFGIVEIGLGSKYGTTKDSLVQCVRVINISAVDEALRFAMARLQRRYDFDEFAYVLYPVPVDIDISCPWACFTFAFKWDVIKVQQSDSPAEGKATNEG